ncbi:MAG: hypothetical protein JSV17_02425 [Candidatus Aminicenantes bacterium]|nr:MAG: hypothetical protein JSV17_02425 [Candidatus Aminicenantes bacterium]
MKKKLKKILIILGSIVLFFLLLVVIALLMFFYRKPLVKGIIEKQIEKRTGIHVTIGTLDYELFPLIIEAGEIEFATLMDETEVDVFVEKLVLKGDIHRIRKKVRPYFDTIEGEGVRIISNVKEARKKIMIEDILRSLSSGMSFVRKISLNNSSIEFNFPSQKLFLQGFDFALSPSGVRDSFAYTLHCRNAEGIGQPQSNRFQNTIQGSGTLSLMEKPEIEGRFILTSNRFAYSGKEQFFEEINLNFNGKFNADKNEYIFPSFEIEIPSYASLTGPLEIIAQDELTLHFRPLIRIDDLGRVFSMTRDQLPQQLKRLELGGSAFFEGEARITPTHPEQKASITGLVVLNPSHIKYRSMTYQFDSQISGSLKIDRFPDNQNISGRLKIAKSAFAGKALEASGIKMEIPFVYDQKRFTIDIKSLKAAAATLSIDIPNRKLKTDAPSLSGQGFIDLKNRNIQISQAKIVLHPFPPFEVEAQAGLGPQDSNALSVSVQSSRIDFQSLMDFFSFTIPQKVIDWEPDGWLKFKVKAHNSFREKQKVWEMSARLEADDVNFHDPSFTVAGESLHPNLSLEGTFYQSLNDIVFKGRVELTQGESLWKDFYINWSKMPILGTFSGRFNASQGKLTDLSVGATIPEFGRIAAEGRLDLQEPRSSDLKIMASTFQLAPLYTFITQKGAVSQTQVKLKGEAECQIDAKIDENAFSIFGYLKIKDASWIEEEKNLVVQGIEATIPLHYEQNALRTKDESAPPERGHLSFESFRSSYLDLSPIKLDISSKKNGYFIQPFKLEIFGSEAEVGETSIMYGFNPSHFKALTSFSWKVEDLSQLPLTSQDFQLEGTLSVDLPLVEVSPEHLSTEGQGEAGVFGGNIALENIQVHQPFSKNRTVSCDVRLTGLDLEKITDSIPFGRVTGILNGEIQDLALSYGQPESFSISIESERRKGVPQRFSLKATNDLAILGTGEKTPFSPQSGWTRIVKEFRYKKIGIACSLKNDIFSLRGTIHRKGIEYLVKGSGLFAINVVNKQVRNQIQFKDMLNRLKRIGESKQAP